MTQTNRMLPLDAMRGIAATIVTLYHFAQAFADSAFQLTLGTPLFLMIAGDAAVAFFFVLSGSVNCRPMFRDTAPRVLARNLLRRYPRLMVPALLATLFSWALFALDLYYFREAAAITGSPWLASMANGVGADFQPSLLDALYQGIIGCFVSGKSNYVPPLWTMYYELLGSTLVMVVAALLARRQMWSGLALGAAVAVAVAVVITPYYLPTFICGTLLTFVMMRRGDQNRPGRPWVMVALLAAAIYLLSYAYPIGMHGWIPQPDYWLWIEMQRIVLQTAGAILLIIVGLRWGALQRLASGRVAALLGELSLPVFLLHVPIYCSASSWVLVQAVPKLGYGAAVTLAGLTAIVLTLPAAWVFARIDKAWGPLVNRGADAVLARLWPLQVQEA